MTPAGLSKFKGFNSAIAIAAVSDDDTFKEIFIPRNEKEIHMRWL